MLFRSLQAALTSAITFSVGAAVPLLMVFIIPGSQLILGVATVSMLCLTLLGGLASFTGGSSIWVGMIRVTVWGALALALTTGIGKLFGTVI